jgi:glycosyltransferase involved in cell wall biosynthesis
VGPSGRLSYLLDPRDAPASIEIPHEAVVPATSPPGPALAWGRVLGPRWIGAANPDVFHATFLSPPRVPRSVPWVATIHDLIPLRHPARFSMAQRIVFGASLRLAARAPRVIAVSAFTANLVHRALGVPLERLRVVPPPIDVARYAAPPGRGVQGVDGRYLLHLGGFDPLKGVVERLLPAFARLVPEARDLVLVATGSGPGRAEAERAARGLGLAARVHFAGHLDDDAHVAALAGAAAVVVSSSEEGFGMPVAEGLAAGVPVAIGSAEASREAGAGVGFLAADDSAEALARAILEALESGGPSSAAGAERRAAAGRFDVDRVAGEVLAVYRELLPAGA